MATTQNEKIIERLWAKSEPTMMGCWVWTGGGARGYGQIRIDGRTQSVHRLSYELLKGPIPPGLHLDHKCRVRPCWNPEHLEPVTNKENILRGNGPSAHNAKRTHCINGHTLTGDNLYLYPGDGSRKCKECKRQRDKTREAFMRRVLEILRAP